MAGYGNLTAPSTSAADLPPQHTNTRLNLTGSNTAYHNPHEKHGSGTTSGAGFGNKRSSFSSSTSSSDLRITPNTSSTPYSHPAPRGSGATAGAGYGNKTGEMGGSGGHEVLGKAMEKVGSVIGSERVVRMGRG